MTSAVDIVLEYVCPAAGIVTGTVMFAAPLRDVYKAAGQGDLGNLNPTPWAFMLGNCFGWITYGILLRNFFVYFANVPGFLFSIWLNGQAVQLLGVRSQALREKVVTALQQQQQQQEAVPETAKTDSTPIGTRDDDDDDDHNNNNSLLLARIQTQHALERASIPHELLTMFMVLLWLGLASFLVFADTVNSSTKETTVGVVVNLNLVFFYGAPLSTIWTVLQTRSAVSIHIPTMLTNTANGVFWCAYGLAVQDYFIAVPNGAGALLGLVQIVLVVVFPRHSSSAAGGGGGEEEGESTASCLSGAALEEDQRHHHPNGQL